MRLWWTVLTVALSLQVCQGVQPSWEHLKAQPENWKCLSAGDTCGASIFQQCCAGQCCADGRCGACDTEKKEASPVASLRRKRFTDFVGRQFEFPVSLGEVFSIITEADHQVNAMLDPLVGQYQALGITFRGVGIHGPDTTILVSATADDSLDVIVNERPFRGTQLRLDGVTITSGCHLPECSVLNIMAGAVTVSDSFMTLWVWSEAALGGHHLSFKASVTGKPMSQVHGILGQTLDNHGSFVTASPATRVALPTNLQFYGEGQPSDYSTTDLFSSDSTFSMFTRKAERRKHRRKRQILEGNALASLALASRSSGRMLKDLEP